MVDTCANAFIEHKTFQVDLGKGGGVCVDDFVSTKILEFM
jgi:hypothetical protein